MFRNWLFWAFVALAAFIGYRLYSTRFSGLVSAGWGFPASGNLPSLLNPKTIVGRLSNGGAIYGPPTSTGGGMPGLGELP